MRLNRILFPIDFSQQCLEFGPYVAGVVKRFDAELTLLHAVDTVPLAYYGIYPAMSLAADYEEVTSEQRKKKLDTFLSAEFANLRVKRVTQTGDAATVVAHYAESHGMDLIMMPTHGYGPFRRLLLGSITAKVLHDTDCLVWTGVHHEDTRLPKDPAFHNILCCLDITPDSLPLLRSAAAIAAELGGELRLVHAIPSIEAATEFSRRALGASEVMYDAGHAEIEKMQREAGTKAELCLETGSVAKVMRSAALRHQADLVIIGRGQINDTLGGLRTNTYAVIRESPCPVLSISPGPRRSTQLAGDSFTIEQCVERL